MTGGKLKCTICVNIAVLLLILYFLTSDGEGNLKGTVFLMTGRSPVPSFRIFMSEVICMTDTQLHTRSRSAFLSSEDWWAVWLGLFIFALGAGRIWDANLLGWAAKFGVWMDPAKAAAANSPAFAWLGGAGAVVVTYLFVLILTTIGAWFMGARIKRFIAGFSVLYWLTVAANILGNYAYLAATPDKRAVFHITWSLSLGELGFVFALVAGLIIGNFFPSAARFLSVVAKPEWYIKTGIVILGANIGIQAISAMSLAGTVIVRGLCAVVEAYLIY